MYLTDMKRIFLTLVAGLTLTTASWSQKKLTEGSIFYDVVINTNNKTPQTLDMVDGATSVVYLKGNSSRSDLISALGTESTIIDGKSGNVTILKDYGKQKFITTATAAEWKEANKKNDDVTYTIENEFKNIAGYNCQKATGKMSDGKTFTVYFTKDLVPANNDFQSINKNLPGLAMEYEASNDKAKIVFTVSNIDFGSVPMSKFDIPTSGYRVIPFNSKK